MKALQLLLFAILISTICVCQTSDSTKIAKLLNGGGTRQWRHSKTIIQLGDECDGGKYLIFKQNVVIEQICVDQKWVIQSYKYKLARVNDFRWSLTYNNKKYFLDIDDSKANKYVLRLSFQNITDNTEVYYSEK